MTRLAIFDFDHTLITRDSFLPFLSYVAGEAAVAWALAQAAFALAREHVHVKAGSKKPETRTFVKNFLLQKILAGCDRDDLRDAARLMYHWQTINPPVMRDLRDHHANGAKIVVASGGLDLYLPEMLRDVPHDALICTDIGVENGIVTGEMIHGNCVRQGKAERVAAWLAENGPFDESWAYGNYPHDVPMMNLVQHRIIVS